MSEPYDRLADATSRDAPTRPWWPVVAGLTWFHVGPDGRVLDGSQYDIVGRPFADLVPDGPTDEFVEVFRRLVTDPTTNILHGERLVRGAQDALVRVRFVAVAARAASGDLDHVRVVALDLGAPGVVEVSRPLSAEHAAALRLADRFELGPRHAEILVLLATGHRITTIASEMHLAPGTVRNRVSELGEALGVRGQPAILRLVHDEVRAAG